MSPSANPRPVAVFLFVMLAALGKDVDAYQDKTTHDKLTKNTFRLVPREYTELHAYQEEIVFGSVAEDGEPRYLYHFWDPTTGRGLPLNSYTAIFTSLHGVGASSSYTTAMDWAWNEMHDDFDWLGAIDAYGAGSRGRAYEGLGHVLHLLQDLGQPDHSRSRPHPGNYIEQYVPVPTVGYEGLWGQSSVSWPAGTTIERRGSLQGFFTGMANLAQQTEDSHGLPLSDEMALGLGPSSYTRVGAALAALGYAAGFRDQNWRRFELRTALVPTIPLRPSDSRYKKYLALGQVLLPRIEQFGAGLLLHFHDIVNAPPYVEEVEILQNGVTKYQKGWNGDQGTSRSAAQAVNSTLDRDVPATVRVKIGPRHPDPADQNRELRERLSTITVTIRSGSGTTVLAVNEGGDQQTSGGIWTGAFTPTESGTLEIEAKDMDPHFPQRQPLGDVLDSNPGTRARATGADRFAWAGYEPGADKNHAFTVIAPAGCHFDAEKNRFGTWTGTYQLDSFNKGFGLQIGGKVWAENTITEKASVRFRSRITASGECHELTRMQFGPGSGSYTRTATTKGKESTVNIRPGSSDRVTTTETPIDKTKTTSGKSFVQGNADLLTGTYSVTLAGEGADGAHAPGFNDSGTITGCQIPTLSGGGSQQSGAPADEFYSRRQWSYSFRYEGPVTPPHAQLCPTCRPFGQTYMAITTYANQAIHLLSEATTVLSQSMRFNEMTTVSNIMSDFGELTNEFDSQLESELAGACERASILWVDESSEYGAAVAEVQAKTQQLDAQQREIATKALQLTQRAAAAVERSVPNAAVSLRKLGQILGTRGWAAFGG